MGQSATGATGKVILLVIVRKEIVDNNKQEEQFASGAKGKDIEFVSVPMVMEKEVTAGEKETKETETEVTTGISRKYRLPLLKGFVRST
jgi:hypothetical protein